MLTGFVKLSALWLFPVAHHKKERKGKMSTKHMLAALCAAGIACGSLADGAKAAESKTAETEEKEGLSFVPGEGVSFGDLQIVTAEFGPA